MFGTLFGGSSRDPEPQPSNVERRTTRANFGFPVQPPPDAGFDDHDPGYGRDSAQPSSSNSTSSGSASSGRATFDRLGQTLVATITVATVTGPEAADVAAELVDQILASQATGRIRHIVLDLQNVQYMDSACIGVLVELLGRLKTDGGRIALVNAASNVEYLFKLTRLDRVFPICRDVMKAIDVVEREG